MVKNRILATGAMLATVAFVAAVVAAPVNAQTTTSPHNGEPHPSGPKTQANPQFTQCPAIGNDTGCQFLLTINPNGTVTLTSDPGQGPYDGSDDTLIGVQNNSSFPVPLLHITGVTGVDATFHFEGDGICTFTPFTGSSYCTPDQQAGVDPQDYQGPDNTFSNISADQSSGDVNLTDSLFPATTNPCAPPTGLSTYFSLEGAITASDLNITPVTPPPCATQTAAPAPTVVQANFTG